jgi:hypothetical protein
MHSLNSHNSRLYVSSLGGAGCICLRLLFLKYKTAPASTANTIMPPTTLPAITPEMFLEPPGSEGRGEASEKCGAGGRPLEAAAINQQVGMSQFSNQSAEGKRTGFSWISKSV